MLNRFCCFRLSTAGVVIGWLGAVVSLLAIAVIAPALGNIDEFVKVITDNGNNSNVSAETLHIVVLIVLCVFLTTNSINLVASALLVTGTVKKRHLLLVPWLLNSGFALLLSCISMLFALTNGPFASIASSLILGGLNFAFNFYVWFAIYSLYKELQQNRDEQPCLVPATSSSNLSYTKI